LLGAIANRLVVAGMLRRIFGFRRQAIRLRFDAPATPTPVTASAMTR
jgi:hypothetical protein